MNCPVCDVPLRMTDRQGVEIDYCPECRGVWLDRGELDKIVERNTVSATTAAWDDDRDEEDRRQEDDPARKRASRRSFLSELFDFE